MLGTTPTVSSVTRRKNSKSLVRCVDEVVVWSLLYEPPSRIHRAISFRSSSESGFVAWRHHIVRLWVDPLENQAFFRLSGNECRRFRVTALDRRRP